MYVLIDLHSLPEMLQVTKKVQNLGFRLMYGIHVDTTPHRNNAFLWKLHNFVLNEQLNVKIIN